MDLMKALNEEPLDRKEPLQGQGYIAGQESVEESLNSSEEMELSSTPLISNLGFGSG
jgi:hypothetical protein